MIESARLWGARFSGTSAEAFDALNASLPVDRRLWREDIRGSRAHARMLGATGIIAAEDAAAIDAGLDQIEAEMESGEFQFAPGDEDIHTAVERRLTEIAGDAGRRLHTGRSRNDQVITDTLLWMRAHGQAQGAALKALAEALLARAHEHLDTLVPGYTHLQRAQPVRLAHHLLAYVWMLDRDQRRLAFALAAAGDSPLGSGAVAGSGFPVDREMVAEEMGFTGITPNSMDAVGSRDALVDYLVFAAQLGVHLSRLGAEFVWWSSEEVGFVVLDDAYASGSSMLPHKKNPDAAELARGKAARLTADLMGLLSVTAGLPLAYNKDLQDDKHYLFDAADTIDLLLPAMTGMVATADFRADVMTMAAGQGFLTATDLADHLVREGWPFRRAHEAVGRLVRALAMRGVGLADATDADFEVAGLGGVVRPDLTAEASVEAKDVPGGTARARVVAQWAEASQRVDAW
ncbi:MAG: argininosuccinate lyase [Thermoleophilia bacterium]|nr:argininosuccinate lyase [Thermoleophilia bacterium]